MAFGDATFAGATFTGATFFATSAPERDDAFTFGSLAAFVATGFAAFSFDAEGGLDAARGAVVLPAADLVGVASTRAAFLSVAVLVGLAGLVFASDLDGALAEVRAATFRVDNFLSDLRMELGIARFSGCQGRLKGEMEVRQ